MNTRKHMTCPQCLGMGLIESTACPKCSGAGRIESSSTFEALCDNALTVSPAMTADEWVKLFRLAVKCGKPTGVAYTMLRGFGYSMERLAAIAADALCDDTPRYSLGCHQCDRTKHECAKCGTPPS